MLSLNFPLANFSHPIPLHLYPAPRSLALTMCTRKIWGWGGGEYCLLGTSSSVSILCIYIFTRTAITPLSSQSPIASALGSLSCPQAPLVNPNSSPFLIPKAMVAGAERCHRAHITVLPGPAVWLGPWVPALGGLCSQSCLCRAQRHLQKTTVSSHST